MSSRIPGISWQSEKAPSAVKADHAARLGERQKPQMVNLAVLCNTSKTQAPRVVWVLTSTCCGSGQRTSFCTEPQALTPCFPIIWEDFSPSSSRHSVHYIQHNHSALLIRKPLICFKMYSMNNCLWKSTEILPQITPQGYLSDRVTTFSRMPSRHYSAFFKNR